MKNDFKPIKNFESYCINSDGLIMRNDKFLKFKVDGPYLRVTLTKESRQYIFCIHRLVYETFVSPICPGKVVNHIDGNKRNNTINNLEVCTPYENVQHAIRIGLNKVKGADNPNSKLALRDVMDIRSEFCGIRGQISNLAEKYNVSKAQISYIVNGKSWGSL